MMSAPLTRPRKRRALEKAGLRYVAAWLPVDRVEALQPEIAATEKIVTKLLDELDQKK